MRTSKKTLFVRVMAILIAALMLGGVLVTAIPFHAHAAEADTVEYPISGYNPAIGGYSEPIPMIVIMINFDADGDGKDHNASGSFQTSSDVKNKEHPAYGEQWCHTTEEDWVNNLFSFEGKTLNAYYKLLSNGTFWWEPAKETYGTHDNGVIAVTIKNVHPNRNGSDGNWVHCYKQIVEAASEYVDFAQYDKNGNGKLDKYELCFAFILGGAETSSGSTTMSEVFGFHAYYKDYDPYNSLTVDGVEVGAAGFFGTGSISGGKALKFGVFAHELGHYLGAPDMYDYNGQKYDSAVGNMSLMASGAHGDNPAHLDPYMLSEFGFYVPRTVVSDGEYTLYSKTSQKGDYNILKICTPNPGEYYLIENRYLSASEGSAFDGSATGRGVIVWHIDENICRNTGMKVNNSGSGYDPGVVVYPILNSADTTGANVLATPGAFMLNNTYPNRAVFKASAYKFPVSETWYTSMTEEDAKKLENLKVTVTSANADEITVKIEGVYDPKLEPEWVVRDTDVTKTSMSIIGTLMTLNQCTLNSAVCELIEVSTKTVVKTDNIVLDGNYQFKLDYTGLKPDTNYEVKITSKILRENESSEATGTAKNNALYTLPDVVKTKAKVTINIGGDVRPSVTANVKVGDCVTISSALLKKNGYKLVGWYLDEAFTTPFDITKPLESTDDFSIYAKWVTDAAAATLTLVGAEADGFVYSAEAGGKFIAPTAKAKKGYTFGGWYADAAFTTEFDFNAAVGGAGEVKIYAKWLDSEGNVADPNATTSGTVGTTATKAPVATDPPAASGGCGSSIASSAVAFTAILGLGAGFVRRKKEQ